MACLLRTQQDRVIVHLAGFARYRLANTIAARGIKETLPQTAEALDLDAYARKVVKDFSKRDGSLKEIPAQQKKLQAVLRHLLKEFEPEHQYTEKQVNEILAHFHPDTASLRRAMIEYKLMQRADGKYWRVSEA